MSVLPCPVPPLSQPGLRLCHLFSLKSCHLMCGAEAGSGRCHGNCSLIRRWKRGEGAGETQLEISSSGVRRCGDPKARLARGRCFFFLFLFFKIYIGVELIYIVVLVSGYITED